MPKIQTVEKVSEDEVPRRTFRQRAFKWEFPDEVFNGSWFVIVLPRKSHASAVNSLRGQAKKFHDKNVTYRSDGDDLYVRVK